nr:caspase family protein [Nostoc flagelliforme]
MLIGVSEYEPGLNPLPGAVKDVEALREVLLHTDMGGFAASDITLLKNPERQDVEEAIERLFTYQSKDDLVLFYFSGHGIKDDLGQLYLATRKTRKNSKGELVRSTAVAARFIQQCMSFSRSRRQVVILDSCFSGAFAEGMSAKDDGIIDIREQLGGEGRAVLTSSTSTQYSFEEQGQDLSIYTRFLIEGIKSGEADRDQDEFISIDELHEYASLKVRELQPAMKPEIYAIREGFKIRLAKVAPGDPRQRYRKEVARFIHRGEISFVGRRTLDVLRTRLGLETTETKAIEDEVLEPYRKEFREKLQQYEQVFTELLERDETITDADRSDLQNLQQILGLRNEDTMPIEAQVTAQLKTHQQNLQTYEQAFTAALRQEYPLSTASRDRLRQTQQQLELTNGDVAAIESQITAEVEVYHQKLQNYERLFFSATQQEYPLSEATRNNLRQQQQRLGLTDVDVAPIEAQITTQIESYHQKLQQYEQAFVKATQRKHYPDEVTRKQLQQTWQTLGLSDGDVRVIESRINAEIETYQANLRQYEQEFTEAVQQEYPLSAFKRSQLTQRHQALNLTAEDVTAIENSIVAALEEHRQKLQQYEQVFRESIQFEYPLSDATREELQRFQDILELPAQEVAQIEAKIVEKSEAIIEVLSSESQTKQGNQVSPQELVHKSVKLVEPNLSLKTSQFPINQKEKDETFLKPHEINNVNLEEFDKYISKRIPKGVIIAVSASCGILALLIGYIVSFDSLVVNNSSDEAVPLSSENSSIEPSDEKTSQIVEQVTKFPDKQMSIFYYAGKELTVQQTNSLNNLFKKNKKVDDSFEPVKSGSATTFQGWNALCIGQAYSECPKSARHEILSLGSRSNKFLISRGWVIYKQ